MPDIVLVDLGQNRTRFVFVEVVASSGEITALHKEQVLALVRDAGHDEDAVSFVTAFQDRSSQAYRRAASSIAWGTFVWFASSLKASLR